MVLIWGMQNFSDLLQVEHCQIGELFKGGMKNVRFQRKLAISR